MTVRSVTSPAPTAADPLSVVALTANPRPGSRTAGAARTLADRIARTLGAPAATAIDLADLAPGLFAPEHPDVDAALRTVADADLVVIATPVHKASFTGLLKAFLDLYGPRGLSGVVAVPLVVPGDPAHALVGEVHLRPVLVELGAVVPTRSLVVVSSALGALEEQIDTWWTTDGDALRRAVAPVGVGPAAIASSAAVAVAPAVAR